ncbi:CpsD/CapB family tyrosine-protein kinase [Peribacillus sp. SCS-155]|uniref:CpsD/CapB family tyrosine-protein kinase n=1 Tax=Peribacillus sedimenti TaxID=3115297 RepID=UPI00390576DF
MNVRRKNLNRRKKMFNVFDPGSKFAEQYRIIRTNILFSSSNEKIQSIVVTSAATGEGKTTTVANLGAVMGQQGKRVLIIDADLRKPTLHKFFDKNNYNGLTNILLSNDSLDEVVMPTTIENLDILTSGAITAVDQDLLGSDLLLKLMERMKKVYDIILIDSPPIVENADAQILANICDGSLLVMKSGKTKKDKVAIAKNNLMNCKAKLLGAVLNEKKSPKVVI